MCRIPEPYEIADAYYARLDDARERLLRSVTCADCYNYTAVPDKWAKVPCGYCSDCEEIVEGSDVPGDIGCESYEGPDPDYYYDERTEDDYPERWEFEDE